MEDRTQIIAQLLQQLSNSSSYPAIVKLQEELKSLENESEAISNNFTQLTARIDRINYNENQRRQAELKELQADIDKIGSQISDMRNSLQFLQTKQSDFNSSLLAKDKEFGLWWQEVSEQKDKLHFAFSESNKTLQSKYNTTADILIEALNRALKAKGE